MKNRLLRRRGPSKDSVEGFLNGSYKTLSPELFFSYIFKAPNKNGFKKVQMPMVNRKFS